MKKITAILLVVALATVAIAGSTLAYFQDVASAVNVATVGNVKIEQIEQERDANGNLQPFTQCKPLYPYVGEVAWNDAKININGHDYKMFGEKLKNSLDKIVTVKNTGKSDAYIRTWVALEDPFTTALLGVNVGGVGYTQTPWFAAEIDGVQYSVTCFTYNEALEPGESSLPSLLQVYLKNTATNEDAAKLGETFDILVFSQAVQTNGFANASEALSTAFGADNEENLPWNAYGFNPPAVENNKAFLTQDLILFKEPLLNTMNQNGFTFDGNGHTVVVQDVAGDIDESQTIPMSGIVFSSVKGGNPVVVNDVTITGTFQMVTAGNYVYKAKRDDFNTTFNNVNIVDAELIYFSNNGFTSALTAYGTFTMKDCKVTGNKISAASSVDAPVYDMAVVNQTNVTIDNCEIGTMRVWNQAWVTITNSEIDEIDSAAITTNGLGKLVIGAGTHVGTINLIPGKYSPALTIEDGATVDAIIYNGTTYTQAQWLAANP